jgi:hypothetical protein
LALGKDTQGLSVEVEIMHPLILLLMGMIVGGFDWYVYSGWKFISEHNSCIMGGVKTICWSVNPYPVYAITLIAALVTFLWMFLVFETASGWWNENSQ